MASCLELDTYIAAHRERFGATISDQGRTISPTVQNSHVGAFGGLGDFVKLTCDLFPQIEWAMTLTEKIRDHLGKALGPRLATLPVTLYDPVTKYPYQFEVELFAYCRDNGGLAWLFYEPNLMSAALSHGFPQCDNTSVQGGVFDKRYFSVRINQNYYESASWSVGQRTLANTPGLSQIHPLLRRYVDQPEMMDGIALGAISKSILRLIDQVEDAYETIWLHDWHFGLIAGELLISEPARRSPAIVQHIHNALYQGIYPGAELIRIMGWPANHYSTECFKMHVQTNLLGGTWAIMFGF
ncbi:glycogen/starch synthase [Ruegeria sp. SCP11]|uniref:glycogen/starch synthase n=1 Tax=Ruegeria sp. SCP11 TaxID=3141378 RepID=UPI003338778A